MLHRFGLDCVSPTDLELKYKGVKKGFHDWEEQQENLVNAENTQLVRALNSGESLLVNSLYGTGISQLRSSILEIAETTRGFREPLPRKRVNIREITRTRKYVTFEDYKKVACVECEIQVDQLLSVTSFLHETLKMRHFGISDIR